VLNAAFLVAHASLPKFEAALNALSQTHGETLRFRCIGPTPPANFIELVVRWED
jgi:hypothetical protein